MQLSHAVVALLSITAAGTTAAPIRQSRSVEAASGGSLSARSETGSVARRAEAVAAAVRSLNAGSAELQPSVLAARYSALPAAIKRLRLSALHDLHSRGEIDDLTNAIRSLTEDLVHASTAGAMQRRQAGMSPLTGLQPVVASITCLLNTLLGIKDPLCDTVSGASSSTKAVAGTATEKAANSSQTLADVLTAVAHGLEHGVAVTKNATLKQESKPSKSVNATAKVNATSDAAAIAASMAALPAGASTATIIPSASLKENREKEVDHGSRRRSLEQLESVLRRLADTIPAAPVKRAAMECKTLARTAKDVDEAVEMSAGEASAGSSEADDEGTAPIVSAQNSTMSAQNSTMAAAVAPSSNSTSLATSTSSAPTAAATMVGTTQVKQSAVDAKEILSDGSFPLASQLAAEADGEGAAAADDEGAAEVEEVADDEGTTKEDDVEVEPVAVEEEPVEATEDEECPAPGTPNDGIYRPNCPGYDGPAVPAPSPVDPSECPPAGSVNDGIYRPGCPGYGAPNPVVTTPEPEPTPDPEPVEPGACPPAGTPNDGMWRPNCPGYGGRRDVAASLNRREQSLLTSITPLLNELIKDVSSYLMKTAPAANASRSAAPAVKPISAARITINTRDLLGADGFQRKMVRRQAASSSPSVAPAASAAPVATSTVGPSVLDNLLAGLLGSGLLKSTPAADGTQKLDVQGLRQLVNFAMDRLSVAVSQ